MTVEIGHCPECGAFTLCDEDHDSDCSQVEDDGLRADGGTEQECPNCGGATNQSQDGESRICWKCGTRWSP